MTAPKKNIKKLFRTPPSFASRIGKIVRLDRNERTIPFPEEHLRNILNTITAEEVVAYPELEPFYDKLALWLKVKRDQVLLTSGSDTAIRALFEVYVDDGDEVVMLSPTYGMYAVYCEMFGAIKKEVLYNYDLSLPTDRILAAITKKTKLIIIANPNHTGTVIQEAELIRILEAAKNTDTLVLVDEAYYHFCDITMLPYINDFDNLVIIRTFSKAFGIAPLRIGYVVSIKENIEQLYKVKLTHEITGISAKFGLYLLDHLDIMEHYVSDVRSGIEYLEREFVKIGLTCPKTFTNFLYCALPDKIEGGKLVELLKQEGFSISGPFTRIPFANHIRTTVGPQDQMAQFMTVFNQVYGTMDR